MAEDKKPPISPLLGPDGQPYKGDAAKEQIDDTEKLAAAEKQRLAVMKALNEQGGMNRKQILEINEALDGQLNAYTNLSPEIDAYHAAASSVASTEEELARARGEGKKLIKQNSKVSPPTEQQAKRSPRDLSRLPKPV